MSHVYECIGPCELSIFQLTFNASQKLGISHFQMSHFQWMKGPAQVAATREFFNFLFHNQKARRIIEILKTAPHPEETLFATLNHNPSLQVPGAASVRQDGVSQTATHFTNSGDHPCLSGFWEHDLCVFGILDLPAINKRTEPFVSQINQTFQPLTLDCLEERLFNRTKKDYGDLTIS